MKGRKNLPAHDRARNNMAKAWHGSPNCGSIQGSEDLCTVRTFSHPIESLPDRYMKDIKITDDPVVSGPPIYTFAMGAFGLGSIISSVCSTILTYRLVTQTVQSC